MRYLLIFTFIIFSFCARADQGAMEPPLSETSKAQALQVLAEALIDKDISKQQYDETIIGDSMRCEIGNSDHSFR
jgi:hypothetical protein